MFSSRYGVHYCPCYEGAAALGSFSLPQQPLLFSYPAISALTSTNSIALTQRDDAAPGVERRQLLRRDFPQSDKL